MANAEMIATYRWEKCLIRGIARYPGRSDDSHWLFKGVNGDYLSQNGTKWVVSRPLKKRASFVYLFSRLRGSRFTCTALQQLKRRFARRRVNTVINITVLLFQSSPDLAGKNSFKNIITGIQEIKKIRPVSVIYPMLIEK